MSKQVFDIAVDGMGFMCYNCHQIWSYKDAKEKLHKKRYT